MQNQSITIANTTIHQDVHGRFCLNDLHKAAGYEPRHRPSRWLESQQTKEAVEELSKTGIPALVSVHGGNARGTYVCRVLVYSYAMWISAKFYLKVIHAYDELVTGASKGSASDSHTLPPLLTFVVPPVLSLGEYIETRDHLHDLRAELDVLFNQLDQVDVRCKSCRRWRSSSASITPSMPTPSPRCWSRSARKWRRIMDNTTRRAFSFGRPLRGLNRLRRLACTEIRP